VSSLARSVAVMRRIPIPIPIPILSVGVVISLTGEPLRKEPWDGVGLALSV